PGDAGSAAGMPTAICSPSPRRRARLRVVRSTPGCGPPAARTASSTREPSGRWTSPGWTTRPVTLTTIEVGGSGSDGLGEAWASGELWTTRPAVDNRAQLIIDGAEMSAPDGILAYFAVR